MKRFSSLAPAAFILAVLFFPVVGLATTIVPVPVQTSVHTKSGIYSVTVDDGSGGSSTLVDVNKHWVDYPVNGVPTTHNNVYYAHFSFGGGSARVKITLGSAATNFTYTISPASYQIQSQKGTNPQTITFTLTQSRYVMVKVEDPNYTPTYLVIVADALETGAPTVQQTQQAHPTVSNPIVVSTDYASPSIANAITAAKSFSTGNNNMPVTVYVPSGVHLISAPLTCQTNVNIYLAAGAVVRATTPASTWPAGSPSYLFNAQSVSNVKVFGRGTVDCAGIDFGGKDPTGSVHTGYRLTAPFRIFDSSNITVDGLVLRESTGWTFKTDRCDHVTKQNIKVINYAQDNNYRENDGINLIQCQYSTVSHCFIFTRDDGCCMKGAYDASDKVGGVFEHVLKCTYSDLVVYCQATALKFGLQAYTDITECYFKNIDIVFAVRALGVNAWRGGTFWDKLGFADIRCDSCGSHPFDFDVLEGYGAAADQGYSNVAQLSVVDFNCAQVLGTTMSDLNGAAAPGGTPSGTFDRVTFGNLTIAGRPSPCMSLQDANISPSQPPKSDGRTSVPPTNVQFLVSTDQLRPNGVALTGTGTGGWNTTTNPIAFINDNGSTATEAQAGTSDASVTYNFVSDTAINHARINKDNGAHSVGTWTLERWDQHLETPGWVTVFAGKTCSTDGWNDEYFSTVIGTAVRITFHPIGGSVGVNQVEVYGVKLQ